MIVQIKFLKRKHSSNINTKVQSKNMFVPESAVSPDHVGSSMIDGLFDKLITGTAGNRSED